ncbi:MAG: hypothetical protein JWO52_7049 [Gammaproteobacteria bacterium]|nr:hypothetical protein [Gammaproteobacteria bacterium]
MMDSTVDSLRLLGFEYRGWRVDTSRLAGCRPSERMVIAIQRQLDIVADAGLRDDVVDSLRSIRLWADPLRQQGGAARYCRATGVDFHVLELDPRKPVLLHEYLHALHDQRFGFDDPEILQFYNAAVASARWTRDAYMLSSHREFFAVTASAYVFGQIERPPFSRDRLKRAQPEYCAWLTAQLEHVGQA